MKIKSLILYFSLCCLGACSINGEREKPYKPGEVMVARISTDGNYVITGGDQNSILLWHIPTRTYKIISKDGNGFSPYFIKNSHEFLWQSNKDNVIHVQTIDGKEVMQIPSKHKVYSDAMTSDKRYFFISDFDWLKYRYDTKTKKWKRFSVSAFGGDEKPLNMTLSYNDKHLLTSGTCDQKWDNIPLKKPKSLLNLDCVILWDVKEAKPIRKFWKTMADIEYAALSPDGKTITTGDNNGGGGVFSTKTGKQLYRNLSLKGRLVSLGNEKFAWDNTGFPNIPTNFRDYEGKLRGELFAMQYLASDLYISFTSYIHYSVLYSTSSPVPKKYLNLGEMPFPSVADYSRSGAIDTSIKTHTLVTGQASFDGINVYKFDPKTDTLYRVWSPILNKPPTAPKSLSKDIPTLPGITFDQLSEVKRVDSYPAK